MRRSGLAAAAALLVLPLVAPAAQLGRLAVLSRTGEVLNTEIEVTSIKGKEGESLAARIAPAEVYRSAHVAPVPPVEALRATVERRSDGRPVVRVTSADPVDKPLVNLLVELSWTGGAPVVRQYSFLLDTRDRTPPPVVFAPSAGANAAPPRIGEPLPPPSDASSPTASAAPPTVPTPPQSAPASPQVALASPQVAPAPQAAPAAPSAAIPETGGTYAVQPGDSLLKIAQATRYEGVSFAQMVVAIQRANEDAFIGGDMSKLKSGRTLKIPGRDAVAALSADEARQELAALRGQPAEATRARPVAREPGPAGDDVVAHERALAESRDRAAALEQTRDDLQRLIQAREKEIADIERELAAKSGKSQPIRK